MDYFGNNLASVVEKLFMKHLFFNCIDLATFVG